MKHLFEELGLNVKDVAEIDIEKGLFTMRDGSQYKLELKPLVPTKFAVTHVTKDDIVTDGCLTRKEVDALTAEQMQDIAKKMGESYYTSEWYWYDLSHAVKLVLGKEG